MPTSYDGIHYARYNNTSSDCCLWTSQKLIREIRHYANMERFSTGFTRIDGKEGQDGGDVIRRATKLYRDTWLNPLIDELERRLT